MTERCYWIVRITYSTHERRWTEEERTYARDAETAVALAALKGRGTPRYLDSATVEKAP